jgi:ABC-type multidrug transport system ATPase subunit
VLDRDRQLVGNLSRGLRQRVGLAVALLPNPQVLVLDEPTSGLDPIQRREVRALIRELAEEHTVLLSSHILAEVESVCPRVIILSEGRKVATGLSSRSAKVVRGRVRDQHLRLDQLQLGPQLRRGQPAVERHVHRSQPAQGVDERHRRGVVVEQAGYAAPLPDALGPQGPGQAIGRVQQLRPRPPRRPCPTRRRFGFSSDPLQQRIGHEPGHAR